MASSHGHGQLIAHDNRPLSQPTQRFFLALLISWLVAFIPTSKAVASEQLYYSCQSCHGSDGSGNEATGAPAIAGMDRVYFTRQMHYFRDGIRGANLTDLHGRQMGLVASLFDVVMISDLALYVSKLPKPGTLRRTLTPSSDSNASQLYAACAACHGLRGQGNPELHAPALADLNDWYLAGQLERFAAGVRGQHPDDPLGQAMAAAATGLSQQQINDLSSYIASLADGGKPDTKDSRH